MRAIRAYRSETGVRALVPHRSVDWRNFVEQYTLREVAYLEALTGWAPYTALYRVTRMDHTTALYAVEEMQDNE